MDEPGARFVHGRGERCRRLEAVAYYNHLCRADLWRVPGARLYFLYIDRACDCRAGDEDAEVGHQSKTAKAGALGPNGAFGERTARVYVDLQKTGSAPFGRVRSTPRRCFFSVGPHDQQHHRGNLFDSVLPARLALLDFRRVCWLLANLLGGSLAERRYRHSLFCGGRNLFYFGSIGVDLALGSQTMGAANFRTASEFGS